MSTERYVALVDTDLVSDYEIASCLRRVSPQPAVSGKQTSCTKGRGEVLWT